MAFVQLPSVQLDNVRSDYGNATQGEVTSGNSETYALSDGDTLNVAIDGGGPTTVTFNEVDFANIALATAEEIALVISATLGAAATATEEPTGKVTIRSSTYGSSSSVQVTGGTANTELGFSTSLSSGTDATGLILINRMPEPTEPGVPVSSHVDLAIFAVSGTAPGTSGIDIYVDGNLAYDGDGGGFQTGYDGPSSATALMDVATRRFLIDPTSDFDPSVSIDVRVVVASPALDETYSFTTQDLVEPGVSEVFPTGKKTIRVTFTEPMKQVSATASDDALNPANYTIDRNPPENIPAVDVVVTGVTTVSSSVVLLETDMELSFGMPYLLTVSNAEDLAGNTISSSATDIAFTSFTPDTPEGRSFQVWDQLAQMNRDEDVTNDLLKFTGVMQDVVDLLLSEIDELAETIDPDFAADQFLDAMLYDLGNPFTFLDLTELEKRRLIQTLIPIYKQKGTAAGILNAISFLLGLTVTIEAFNTADAWTLGKDATQARLQSANSETFALTDGWTLIVRVDDTTNETVTFNTAEFVAIGAATAEEVAAVIRAEASGVTSSGVPDGTVLMQRETYGAGTSIQVVGGTAASALGFPSDVSRGEGAGDDVAELGVDSWTAPHNSRQRYTYEIHSAVELTTEQIERITMIATYMHPAHCHLARVVTPSTDPEPDHLELGVSELGGTATDPGTWILH